MVAMEIKLMIDPISNNVIFAEANKDFVDFLIFLLSLPIGTAIKLLTSESMVGSIGNVYKSVANLDESYLQPNIKKNVLLNPFVFSSVKDIPLSLNRSTIISSGKFYACGGTNCEKCFTNVPYRASCPDCCSKMSKEIDFSGSYVFEAPRGTDKKLEGYVKKEASYMISDDLSVTLISTMSILSTMEKFSVSKLKERKVKFGSVEALELLKASLQSTTVLNDVFRKMEDGQGGDFAVSENTSEDVVFHEHVEDDIAEVEEEVKDGEMVELAEEETKDEAAKVEEKRKDDEMDEAKEELKDEAKETVVETESNEAIKENDESKEPEADKPLDMKKNEKDKEREEDSKVLKKRPEGKGSKKETSKKKEEEPKTPNPAIVNRPVRERKTVERLVSVIVTNSSKEVRIEKGRGTALKDIPNVAFQLLRRKCDNDTWKLLHSILFGRRGKAALIKSNISRFSGFVWRNNEDKQKNKIKEKVDKCSKEQLVELCEILDIQVSKVNFAKEEVIVKLMEFLEAPHVTTSELLSEKEHSSKGSKSAGSSSDQSSKRAKTASGKGEEIKAIPEPEEGGVKEEQEEDNEENVNGLPERSDDEMSEQSKSEESEIESDDDYQPKSKQQHASKTAKKSVEKGKSQKVTVQESGSDADSEEEEEKSKEKCKFEKTPPSTRKSEGESKSQKVKSSDTSSIPKPSPTKTAKRPRDSDTTSSAPNDSKKKKFEPVKEKYPAPNEEEAFKPSDDQLRVAIRDILKQADFKTTTITNFLKQLAKQFESDLTARQSSIKLMIQDEVFRMVDEERQCQ